MFSIVCAELAGCAYSNTNREGLFRVLLPESIGMMSLVLIYEDFL